MLLLWCKQSYHIINLCHRALLLEENKFSSFTMCSIDCLLCRLVQKVFLILATVKGRIRIRWFTCVILLFEILFPEVILRCKLPPSKSTIWIIIQERTHRLFLEITKQGQDRASLLTTLCTLYLYTHTISLRNRSERED